MEYEYGTGQQGLNYPNPYTIENIFLSVRTGIFALASVFLFILAKIDLSHAKYFGLAINLIGATGFLYGAISTGYLLSRQLRVYFGRGQPSSLAPDFGATGTGMSKEGNNLKETIRQGALNIQAPPGNLNGLLYSRLKSLIIAPYEIQALAQRTFSNLIKIAILFALFLLSLFFAGDSAASGWLGAYFFVATASLILAPLFQKKQTKVNLDFQTFWFVFAASIIVPILLIAFGDNLPQVEDWSFGLQSFFILAITIAGEVLGMIALRSQLFTPSGLTTSFEQAAVSFNASPAQINAEVERELQKNWVASIPNRVYARVSPNVLNQESGTFQGQLMQETQPMAPRAASEPQTLQSVRQSPRFQYLFLLDIVASVATIISTLGLIILLLQFQRSPEANYTTLYWSPFLVALLFLSSYWMKLAHGLWGRFDFESKLYIVEYEGTYSMAQMNFGNQIKDSLQTKKQIINIETMTLRVWVTDLNTVVFNHGINSDARPRFIINMLGLTHEAKAFLAHIKQFIENQSMILKPNAGEDLARVSALAQLNSIGESVGHSSQQKLEESQRAFAATFLGQQPNGPVGGPEHNHNSTSGTSSGSVMGPDNSSSLKE